MNLVWGSARLWPLILASRGMPSKFYVGPWQKIKDEALDMHLAVPFVGGQEAEEDYLLPDPLKAAKPLCMILEANKSMSPHSYTTVGQTKPACSLM